MELHALTDLPLLPLRITARAVEPLSLPANAASSLRGAFGAALYELVCAHRERRECAGCPLEELCAYPTLFAPRARDDQAGTSGFRDLPRPYVIRAEQGEQALAPGDLFGWRVTLIGRGIQHLAYFALAWRGMGAEGIGRGRGRFDLLRVEALDLDGRPIETLYDRETNLLRPGTPIGSSDLERWGRGLKERPREDLEVRFLTPTLIKRRGEVQAVPHFPALWHAVQLRLSTLRLAHGAGRPEMDFSETLRQAEEVRLVQWDATEVSWERYSSRQDRRVPMHGFVGTARYGGAFPPFLRALKLGTLAGVGDNCTFGQGEYEVVGW